MHHLITHLGEVFAPPGLPPSTDPTAAPDAPAPGPGPLLAASLASLALQLVPFGGDGSSLLSEAELVAASQKLAKAVFPPAASHEAEGEGQTEAGQARCAILRSAQLPASLYLYLDATRGCNIGSPCCFGLEGSRGCPGCPSPSVEYAEM